MKIFKSFWTYFLIISVALTFCLRFYLESKEPSFYINEKFVVVEKGDYANKYYLLRRIKNEDQFIDYTVLTPQNFMYNQNQEWDQLYYSKYVGDTLLLEKIAKKKFWNQFR